jgi:AraC family transcriptional regulator
LTRLAPASKHGAMILTELPDLPPRPLTSRAAAFRHDFYRRWGRENCVISGMSRHAEYGLFRQTLSIKCVAYGSEMYFVDRRRVTVNDDTFLVLNEGREYGSVLTSATDTYSFSIFFRPGLGEEVAAGLQRRLGAALDDGPRPIKAGLEFDESLQHHNSRITPVLRFIQRQIATGVRDENWLEEQCQFLLERLISAQRQRKSPFAAELDDARRPQRAEVTRRLRWAIDFMHAHLAEDITLEDIAAAARLSRFHFLRVFQAAHGRTPVAFLRELRARRALAMLGSTTLGVAEIAERVGMSRVALWRSLHAQKGIGARAVRQLDEVRCAGFLPPAN